MTQRSPSGVSFSGLFDAAGSLEDARFALIGAPHDSGSSFRPGARLAPPAIRAMAQSMGATTERGHDLAGLAAVDAGDLELPGDAARAYPRIERAVTEIVDAGAVPVVLGGDHAITVPAFTAVQRRRRDVELLYLDAHPDLYPEYADDPYSHACVVHRILRLDGVDGRRVTQVGIRATSPAQRAAAEAAGLRTVPAWEVDDFVYAPSGPVYLSVDIDVLDPAHAPGCGNPVPGGLSTRQLLGLLQGLAGVEVVAMDVVEVNPLLDPAGITALAAARVVTETLGAVTLGAVAGL